MRFERIPTTLALIASIALAAQIAVHGQPQPQSQESRATAPASTQARLWTLEWQVPLREQRVVGPQRELAYENNPMRAVNLEESVNPHWADHNGDVWFWRFSEMWRYDNA